MGRSWTADACPSRGFDVKPRPIPPVDETARGRPAPGPIPAGVEEASMSFASARNEHRRHAWSS